MQDLAPDTMAARIVRVLRDEIVTLVLKPGDVISESDIASRHGVSRQPVREAFIRLAQQGLLLIRPKRATVIKKISAEGVRQSGFIRQCIEVEIVRRLAGRPTIDAGATLEGLIAQQIAASNAGDTRQFHSLDEAFHRQMALLAGVEYAWQLVADHKIQLDRVRFLTLGRSATERAINEHRQIVAAVMAGNAVLAEALVRTHLGHAAARLTLTIAEYPHFFETIGPTDEVDPTERQGR